MGFTYIDYADACGRQKACNCFAKHMHSKVLNWKRLL